MLAPSRRVWLDGGHNADAGEAIARYFGGRPVHLIVGMLANKNPKAIIEPLNLASLTAVPIPGSEAHPPAAFGPAANSASGVASALSALPDDGRDVLIAGSLYLAGAVLSANGEVPD
jgi:dihydrofolate synthase/folylpolyglutamate synthase